MDEVADKATSFRCGECWHLYVDDEALRQAWLDGFPDEGEKLDLGDGTGLWSVVRKPAQAPPADEIFFCPVCSHNF